MLERMKQAYYNFRFKFELKLSEILGYIENDGTPIKCQYCKSKELEECNHDYLDATYQGTILEFDCRCKNCGKIIGHWAHGHWCA